MNDASQASSRLQNICLSAFREWQPLFQSQFPDVRFSFWSAEEAPLPLAEARRNLFFSATRNTWPDTLELQFTFSRGPSPLSVEALLLWGDEAGKIEMLLADRPVSVLDPSCDDLDRILERFRDQMMACLVLGHPTPEPTQTLLNLDQSTQ